MFKKTLSLKKIAKNFTVISVSLLKFGHNKNCIFYSFKDSDIKHEMLIENDCFTLKLKLFCNIYNKQSNFNSEICKMKYLKC